MRCVLTSIVGTAVSPGYIVTMLVEVSRQTWGTKQPQRRGEACFLYLNSGRVWGGRKRNRKTLAASAAVTL